MAEMSYWSRLTQARFDRRRAIVAAGGATLGVVALSAIGCGGSSSGSGSSSERKSGTDLVAKPVDSTSKAKAGGVLKHWAPGDPAHLDPLLSSNANVVNFVSPYAYPRLMKWVPGTYPKSADGSLEGFAAESYEVSPDKLQITFKLRQDEVGLARADQRPSHRRPGRGV